MGGTEGLPTLRLGTGGRTCYPDSGIQGDDNTATRTTAAPGLTSRTPDVRETDLPN
jgi:hypothetical protein